jgi:hypothetical protein
MMMARKIGREWSWRTVITMRCKKNLSYVAFTSPHLPQPTHLPLLLSGQTLAYSLSLASIEADTYLATPNYFLSHPLSNRTKHDHPEPVPIEKAGRADEPDLYVGHTPLDLRKDKTLRSVYLDRIWEILERYNQGRGHRGAGGSGSSFSDDSDSESLPSFDNDDKHGSNEHDKEPKRGIRGKKEWDWNGLFTEQGEKDRTLLFYIDVVSPQFTSSHQRSPHISFQIGVSH